MGVTGLAYGHHRGAVCTLVLAVGLFFGFWGASPASALPVGTEVTAIVDSVTYPVPISPDPEDPNIGLVDYFLADPNGEWEMQLTATLDMDPQITYLGSVIDFFTPSTFGFIFSLPIIPEVTPGFATHSHSSSTTDGGGPLGTSVTAVAPPLGIPVDLDATPEIAVFTLSTNGGASFLSAGLDLSPSFVGASPGDVQGPFNENGLGPAGAGLYDTMRVDVNFSMTGSGDAFTFNGVGTIIPEPGSLGLMGLGLGGLAYLRRRQRP